MEEWLKKFYNSPYVSHICAIDDIEEMDTACWRVSKFVAHTWGIMHDNKHIKNRDDLQQFIDTYLDGKYVFDLELEGKYESHGIAIVPTSADE